MSAWSLYRHQRLARRAAQITLLIAFVAQVASCGTTTNLSSEERLREDLASFAVASETSPQKVFELPPGWQLFWVKAKWSNGRKDDWHFDNFKVPPNGKFTVFAYEIGHGLVPAALHRPKPKTSTDKVVEAMLGEGPKSLPVTGPLIIMTAPIWGPIAFLNATKDRLGENCCFVWIEDANTGEQLAGESPGDRRLGVLTNLHLAPASSLASKSGRAPNPVPAGQLFSGDSINARVPNSDGWLMLNPIPPERSFVRRGPDLTERTFATANMVPLEETKNNDEFLSLIKKIVSENISAGGYEVVKTDFEHTEKRGYPCVAVSSVVVDKEAHVYSTRREVLSFQERALYCRHPERQNVVLYIVYSHRGTSFDPSFDSEAQWFISEVQIPRY